MYGDEEGGFWFKGLPMDRNSFAALLFIFESYHKSKLSPSKLYDKIVSEHLDREYVFAKIDLLPAEIDSNKLSKFLNGEQPLDKRVVIEKVGGVLNEDHDFPLFTAHEYKLEDESRVVMQSNPKNNFVELYVESPDKEIMHEIVGDIQHLIYIDG